MSKENPLQSHYDTFDPCREHDIPLCADACPFRLDVLDLQAKMASGRFNAAYKTLIHDTAFPGIVSQICPAYCQQSCIRQVADSPVQLRNLERSAVALATRKDPPSYNMPPREGKLAVIGAGLSGLGFALRMASKKYEVTVYEKESQIGGSLKDHLEESIYLDEFALQFKHESYTLHTSSEVRDLAPLLEEGYQVIYVATGSGGASFSIDEQEGCSMIGKTAVFLGGELLGLDPIQALACGLETAQAAEHFLHTEKLERSLPPPASRAVANEDLLTDLSIPSPNEEGIYTAEDAKAEAARCIRCQCDGCQQQCDIVSYFKTWPLKMRDEIYVSTKPAGSLVHKAPARGYINTCTQCGLFSEICPEGFDLCEMIRVARREMHKAGKNPGGYRQYWLRDMAFANGPYAALTKTAPTNAASTESGKHATPSYAFFPGCNLGALDPAYVIRPYRWLVDHLGNTGMLLRCCNIPVDWDGNEELHGQAMEELRQEWTSLGEPVLITACMSCDKHLHEFLPEAKTQTLYEIMAEHLQSGSGTLPESSASIEHSPSNPLAVFDPCSARGQNAVQSAVRQLANHVGIQTEELPKGDLHGCCGYGGDGSVATPGFSEYVANRRGELSELPYLVYCSNCRDVFSDSGKSSVHILDLLFDIDPAGTRPQPGISQRRENRIALKEELLKEFWREPMSQRPGPSPYQLTYEEDAADKAERQRILEEDICFVIRKAEETGRRTRNPENGHYKAYREIGHITFWVEYSCPDGEDSSVRRIHNLYSHRMHIELEAVFNGKKIDAE